MKKLNITLLLLTSSIVLMFSHPLKSQTLGNPELQSIVSPQKTITLAGKTIELPGKTIELPEVAITGSYAYFPSNSNELPVIMIPGLGLSSWIFTHTPDGRQSWADTFSQAGHDVYVYNDPSIFVNPTLDYSAVMNETSQWQAQRAWGTWGMGQRYPTAYENTRYPIDEFDKLLEAFPPYTSFAFLQNSSGTPQARGGGRGRGGASVGNNIKVNNLLALIDQVGDCVLMVHSMSGITGYETIKQNNEHIKGLIVIEPVGSPSKEDIQAHYTSLPFLGVYGDYIDQRRQTGRKEAVTETIVTIQANDGTAEMIDLPAMGIAGNTHLMMQDNNNTHIAKMILEWMNRSIK